MFRSWLLMIPSLLLTLNASAQDATTDVPSESSSLYELGFGAGSAWFPHYPGSDQERLFALPFPYFVYRGHILRSNREEGTRARFLRGENYELSMSVGGAFPVSSENNVAREGMPDLGWIVELGPKLRFHAVDFEDGGVLRLGLAVRSVLTSQQSWTVDHRGTVLETELVYDRPRYIANLIDFRSEISTRWASEPYQSYLYEVPARYARAGRPEYSARGGYLYSMLGLGIGYTSPTKNHRFALFGTLDSLAGGANVSSPLVKTQTNTTVAIAYITVLNRSEAKAVED